MTGLVFENLQRYRPDQSRFDISLVVRWDGSIIVGQGIVD